jgi:hypothetical protein
MEAEAEAEASELAVVADTSEARVSVEWAVAAFAAEWAEVFPGVQLAGILLCARRQWGGRFRPFARAGNFTHREAWRREILHA